MRHLQEVFLSLCTIHPIIAGWVGIGILLLVFLALFLFEV